MQEPFKNLKPQLLLSPKLRARQRQKRRRSLALQARWQKLLRRHLMNWKLKSVLSSALTNSTVWFSLLCVRSFVGLELQLSLLTLPCRSWGNGLKKEINAVSNLSLELPQNNQLRKVLGDYKVRFEEAIDEFLGWSYGMLGLNMIWLILSLSQVLYILPIPLRLKSITTEANLLDLKSELDEEAGIRKFSLHMNLCKWIYCPFERSIYALIKCSWVSFASISSSNFQFKTIATLLTQVKQMRLVKAQGRAVIGEIKKQSAWECCVRDLPLEWCVAPWALCRALFQWGCA